MVNDDKKQPSNVIQIKIQDTILNLNLETIEYDDFIKIIEPLVKPRCKEKEYNVVTFRNPYDHKLYYMDHNVHNFLTMEEASKLDSFHKYNEDVYKYAEVDGEILIQDGKVLVRGVNWAHWYEKDVYMYKENTKITYIKNGEREERYVFV